MKIIKKIIVLIIFGSALGLSAQKNIKIDATQKGENFDHYWSKMVGAGRANEALRAGWLEQMQQVQENCGFEYVRFHGLFHDDMFPVIIERGKTVYNWQYIDDVFDRLLDLNVKPFIELAFLPTSMAAENSKTVFWWKANITPADDTFEKWHDLVKAFTQHCVDRYGMEEVLTWYFEVWNEPNLYPLFWDGTKSQYFELYKQSALAVKSVDSRLKIGGPSTSNFVPDTRFDGETTNDKASDAVFNTEDINALEWHGVWIEDFLKYCKKEKLPVDFISTHPYPTDYAFNPETGKGKGLTRFAKSLKLDLEWLNKTIAKSAFPDVEIHLTEWNTSPSSRDAMHDRLPAAAYIVKSNLDCIGLTNSLAFWTFTDIFEEKGGASSIFHGGFGMINYQGLVKPSYHAYRMLHELGNQKLYKDDYLFVSKEETTGKISALAYNYPEEYENAVPFGSDKRENGTSKNLDFTVTGLKAGTLFEIEILDKDHGNIHNFWESMGKPEPPTREEIKVMKTYANTMKTEHVKADVNGSLTIKHEITPWSLVLIKQVN
ncbi:glycoside hydrolase [Algibacter amylolyticus]|uniref:Glycoside hydrolase n=1 Tax=Algibacter amylolyticus TaxID=1608400 RepID=A0A5M7B7F6_9FLAO|nr:glycoside hydrolase [Algibacter amylolyticus]KAA5825219.1 glycoside hydrolase [Algibacter amylolyticus]MBB5268659.1 xylan 1,4-beta-xylosidase [Algibacter amylolyticus]TSJ77713.1 glycoside hydrolase [Algibacter amylolyticus]